MNIKIIKKYIRSIMRKRINRNNRKRLKNKNFTIISSNCIGGVISSELGERFNSPTVNMYFNTSDFIKFVKNIDHYINFEWVEVPNDNYNYPIAKIDDIIVHLVHYEDIKQAKEKWDLRKKRINYDNIFIIAVERDGCTIDDIKQFNNLNFNNKVIFTKDSMPQYQSAYHIPNTKEGDMVMDICKYKSKLSSKRWIDDFDYVSFFNLKK